MQVDSFSSGGYEWFERAIKIIDALTFLNINGPDSMTELDKDKLEAAMHSVHTKVNPNAISKLHTVQSNALLSYNMWNGQYNSDSASNSPNWTIIQLNSFKQISVAANISIKTQDFIVMRTMIQYLNRTLYLFCIYETDVTVPDLKSIPLAVFSLLDGIDIYSNSLIEEAQNYYLFKSKNQILLKVYKNTLSVSECFMDETMGWNDTAISIISSILEETGVGTVGSKVKTIRDVTITRIKRMVEGVSIYNEELKWVCTLFDINFEEAITSLDKIIKTAAKDKEIDVFGNTFKVIDIMRCQNNILMIRTTYFDESSQFIMLFEVSESIQTLVFCILDVFPHEGISDIQYDISNNIKSSSREDIIGCSHVKVLADDDIMVIEDINLRYNNLDIAISDNIIVKDNNNQNDEQESSLNFRHSDNVTSDSSNRIKQEEANTTEVNASDNTLSKMTFN